MSLATRLKKARLKKKMTQQQLASEIGIKQQAVQRIEAGKVKSTSYIVQIAHALDVSPDWLALGPEDEPVARDHSIEETTAHYSGNVATVPLLNWNEIDRANALIADPSMKHQKVPCLMSVSPRAFAVRVQDDSMLSSDGHKINFHRDDILIVDPAKQVKDRSYVIAKTPHIILRQYVADENGAYLKALNPKYESITCQDHQLLGVVLERITHFH